MELLLAAAAATALQSTSKASSRRYSPRIAGSSTGKPVDDRARRAVA